MSSHPHNGRRAWRALSGTTTLTVLLAAGATLVATPASSAPAPRQSPTAAPSALTADQALAQARKSGKDVQATAATTADSTLTAHPNGTYTVTQTLAPVRKWTGKAWVKLDPTLKRNPDGSITTTATTSGLTLSAGGDGPLATMAARGHTLALTMPVTLPAPTLSGPTATYPGVLPGVDLRATADAQGSLSEILVVKTAQAAANPALKTLTLATTAKGLHVTSDKAGDITLRDAHGPVYTTPPPMMWDSARQPATPANARSAAAPAPVKDPRTGRMVNARTGDPIDSTPEAPGAYAHTAPLGVSTTQADQDHATIRLTPDTKLLSSPDVAYPVYESATPTFVAPSAPSSLQAWTYTNSYYSTSTFWKTSNLLRVGYTDDPNYPPNYTARSYLQISVPSAIYGSTVLSSELDITEVWSWSCTKSTVEMWTTASGISSSTDWANQPAPKSEVDYHDVAYGWSSACPTNGVGFNIISPMQTAANSGTTKSLTFVLKAPDGYETNDVSWKKFDPSTTKIATTYDHKPNTPTQLATSPTTSCQDDTVVGDGNVTLYAGVSDPDGRTVGSHFQLLPHGATSPVLAESSANSLTSTSGSTSVFVIPKSTLENAANGAVTDFDWRIQVSDFYYWGSWSKTCHFRFDPTRNGPPNIAPVPDQATTIGAPYSVAISRSDQDAANNTAPSSYEYQLNGGAPLNVKADASGNATVTITPTRRTNVLTVSSLSAGANYGDSASIHFNSQAPAAPADGDLTGDNIPDLLTVGGQNNLPSGLWLANAKADPGKTVGNGHVATALNDIGINGNGFNTNGSAADFNGAQAITGRFSDSGLQDVLAYYPKTGTGVIISGNGDGSALASQYNENLHRTDPFMGVNWSADPPSQIVNAGNTSGSGNPYPDIIGTYSGTLTLYQAQGNIGSWIGYPLSVNAPDGGADWSGWTLASMQLSNGSTTSTALFLWNQTTGQLDLWENLSASVNQDGLTATLTYTDYPIATSNWNAGATLSLQAADINGDGTPDLWTVNNNGTVTSHLFANLSASPTATDTQLIDTVTTAGHAWPLNDADNGSITTAADTIGALHDTGTGGVTWTTGDLFSPAAHFDGSGVLTTGSSAVDTTKDFTVSAWVKASAFDGRIVGQKGTHTSGFALFSDASTKSWRFEMPQSDADNPTEDVAAAVTIPAQLGTWVRLTGTYTASTGRMVLYIDDVAAAQASHTTKWPATGALTTGAYWYNDTTTGHFVGNIADVQTFSRALTAKQVAILAGNPGPTSYAHINDNHDFNADGTADVVAQWGDGTLHLYTGAAESYLVADGQLWDSTWSSIRLMTSGNFTDSKDNNADIVAIWGDGTAHLYTSSIDSSGNTHLTNAGQLTGGTTWSGIVQIAAADFTGDGHTDLLAIWGDGSVHIYAGNGNGTIASAGPNIWNDNSWATMKLLGAGDYNNDGHADLLAEWSDGNLHLYTGDGNGHLTQSVQMMGKDGSWSTVKGIVPGDFTDDGLTDLVGVWGDGTVHLYTGDGNGNLTTGPNLWDPTETSWKTMGLIA